MVGTFISVGITILTILVLQVLGFNVSLIQAGMIGLGSSFLGIGININLYNKKS